MGKHLVLAGGGHAHLTTISAIRSLINRGHDVTVIAPSDFHYYSGMAPGMLSGTYRPQEIRFNIRKLTTGRGGQFIRGMVIRVNADQSEVVLEDGQRIAYDVVSFNVGSVIPPARPVIHGGSVYTVKPVDRVLEGRAAILDLWNQSESATPVDLNVVGGGPAGVEMAGALWRLTTDEGITCRITLITGGNLLEPFSQRLRTKVSKSLSKRGIRIREMSRVLSIEPSHIVLEDKSTVPSDITFVATGVIPSRLFMESRLPTAEDGGLLVNDYLQSLEYPRIFGGGDCITIRGRNLARVGVYAVRQNPLLLHNLSAALENKPLKKFNPGNPDFLLILNLGDSTAVFKKGEWIWKGALAFRLKDFIDRRFMRKFQLSGELNEPLNGEPVKPLSGELTENIDSG
jgi:NADH dehydrogenase FAD-containing subunit